jgi:hypothetical protein
LGGEIERKKFEGEVAQAKPGEFFPLERILMKDERLLDAGCKTEGCQKI